MTPMVHSHYRSSATETAAPEQLVLMLFDNMLARLTTATEALSCTPVDNHTVHHALVRTQAILDELRLSLDRSQGATVADGLASLYTFCIDRLVDANLTKSLTPIDDVRTIIAGLRDAWDTACIRADEHVAAGMSR